MTYSNIQITRDDKGRTLINMFNVQNIILPNFDNSRDMGSRGFNVRLTEEEVEELEGLGVGFAIKRFKPRHDTDLGDPHFHVVVSFRHPEYAPKVIRINDSDGSTVVCGDQEVSDLQDSYIDYADLQLSPSYSRQNNRVTMYLNKGAFHVGNTMDTLTDKYNGLW